MSGQTHVTWIPIDLYMPSATWPKPGKLVWLFEPNDYGFPTPGYIEGRSTFMTWQRELIRPTHWAPMTYPETPYVP